MGRNKNISLYITLGIVGFFAVIWFALLAAPHVAGGMPQLLAELPDTDPFDIQWCEDSLSTVIILLCIYAFVVMIFVSMRKNHRFGEEHGSAKWGSVRFINFKYKAKCKPYSENILLTDNIRIGLDDRVHKRNVHVLVVGGSGAGKTRYYAKPNVYQANTSFVVIDPKGEILKGSGYILKEKGYEIRVLDLDELKKSDGYNSFAYLDDDNDVLRLVTNLFKATTPKNYNPPDPFWDNAANMLLTALILYLKHEAPEDEQNFPMVLEMLREADASEEDESARSPLDELFEELEREKPGHIALNYYREYRKGAAKTLKSIIITAVVRLEKFNLPDVAALSSFDELDLPSIGEKKVALFAKLPFQDTSFNFIVSMLYTQLFQQLIRLADRKYRGRLPMHVHFLMDEFANISLPDDFEHILAVMRSYNMSASIILQNISQLKALFEKQWESIIGHCDEFLYLGGNEQSTHEYVSKLLGKETIDTRTFGRQRGMHGSFSTNDQNTGRDLLDPAEVRLLDNKYAMLFVRGERPVIDLKYDIRRHPNIRLSADGGANPYDHSPPDRSVATITMSAADADVRAATEPRIFGNHKYELLTDDELEAFLLLKKEN